MIATQEKPGYKILTWGCQMNVEDSEQMSLFLEELGLTESATVESAEVVLLNTCSVRKKPEDKAFSALGVLAIAKEANPRMVIGVCGCMAQLRADEIKKRAPHVDFVIGTSQLKEIPALVRNARQLRSFQKRTELPERKGSVVTDVPQRHLGRIPKLKAFVPIQYGCDKFCTYCIVPTTRGRERSRATEDILEEVVRLAQKGTKEITLLGQTVNSYGKNLLEGKIPFAKLLWKLSEVEGIKRIRYTSPYPRDFSEDLIAAHERCPAVMEHCHLPLQSGDDEMLIEMRRVYTVESYSSIYHRLRQVPGMAITTDVIVGFPGETNEQFLNTMKVMESLRFDSAFMFAYSPRPGTPAGDRKDQILLATKKQRLNDLIALQNEITSQRNEHETGSIFEVLVEGASEKDPNLLKGLTRHFKAIHFPGSRELVGQVVQVQAEKASVWGFQGTILT